MRNGRRGQRMSVTLVEHQGTTDQVRYVKRDDRKGYQHPYGLDNELWLVTLADGAHGVLIIPTGRRPLWERED